MKENFKFFPRTNQWYMNYKGMPISFDKDQFDTMSDEDIVAYIKNKTTQKPKPQPQEDILSHEKGLEEFRKTKEMLNKMRFSDFYNSRK